MTTWGTSVPACGFFVLIFLAPLLRALAGSERIVRFRMILQDLSCYCARVKLKSKKSDAEEYEKAGLVLSDDSETGLPIPASAVRRSVRPSSPGSSHSPTRSHSSSEGSAYYPPSLTTVIVWSAFLVLTYITVRIFYPLLGFSCREKFAYSHAEDMAGMLIRGLVVVAFGNLELRFQSRRAGLSFLGKVMGFNILYSIAYEVCPRASLASGHAQSTKEGFILNGFLQLFLAFVLWELLLIARGQGGRFFLIYSLVASTILSVHVWIAVFLTESVRLHIHHYYWGWLLSFLAPFKDPVSETFQAMMLAFFVHGTAVFGIEPIFLARQTPVRLAKVPGSVD